MRDLGGADKGHLKIEFNPFSADGHLSIWLLIKIKM
jgi:hypothetical protein